MHLFISKLKVFFWYFEKQSIAIKKDVKIPSLLPSILGQSMSARPMQIYMGTRVLLLHFKHPATLKENFTRNVIV